MRPSTPNSQFPVSRTYQAQSKNRDKFTKDDVSVSPESLWLMWRTALKARSLIIVLLVLPCSLTAKTRYTAQQVVKHAKSLDVATLDPTLSSQRLDEWLRSGPAHLDMVTWEMSDCDLKFSPKLCVTVRFSRRGSGGKMLIAVGTFRDGITGTPHFEYMMVGGPNVSLSISERLSDLPRLLDEASAASNGQ